MDVKLERHGDEDEGHERGILFTLCEMNRVMGSVQVVSNNPLLELF